MKEPRQRLHFLDGLRGVASFYVLLFHAAYITPPPNTEFSPWMKIVCAWLGRGRLSVVFFIVLSGFSLMLPIARAGSGELMGGFGDFVRRRARRILPPYYAALVGSIALILAYNVLSRRQGGQPYEAALGVGSILSHVFLFHNVKFDWAYRINGPMWSVATEWQIYFVFALAMLPFFRRFGMGLTLVLSWVIGSLPFFLLPQNDNFFWACPWFIGSFAFGMAGAAIGFSPALKESWLRNKAPWGTLTWASFAVLVGLVWSGLADTLPYPVVDFVVSVFAFGLINACVVRSPIGQESKSLLVRFFGSRALVYLGGFSYSLYLVQHPVFRFTEKMAAKLPLSADGMALVHLLIVCPVIMLLAWFFAELFERPFTSGGIVLPALRRRFRGAEPSVMPNPP